MEKKAPWWLKHKPIITVPYRDIDKKAGAGDARFLTIGHSTWDPEDYSAKVWRKGKRWSRQSEDLPLWRVLDLAILLIAVKNEKHSYLEEYVQDPKSKDDLQSFIKNMEVLDQKIIELKKVLEIEE